MLALNVSEKNVEISTPQDFIRGTVGATCKITFEPFWEEYEKTVVFKRLGNGCITPFVVIANSQTETLSIPHEILAESGYFKIGVYGTKDNVVLPTLWSDNIKIEYGTDTYGEAPQPPTPTVYEQILKTSKNAVDTANSVRQDADNGMFNGEKGEKGDKGDKGDNYVLTLEDKQEIANMVGDVDITVDQTYDPESENAQSGIAVAEAVAEKPWTLIEDITLTEAVTQISIPWDKLQVKELYIEGTIIPVETTKSTQTIQFGLSGTHYWQVSVNPNSTGKIYVTMQVYKSPSRFTIFDGVVTVYPYTNGGSNFIGRSENFKGDYVCPEGAKNLWIRSTVTADTGFDIGTNLRFWGR